MGTSSQQRLAAMMPATCATESTSPFLQPPVRTSSSVEGSMWTNPAARATRWVFCFAETSTMRARPCSLM